ncbi:dehydrogenase [Devosia sp. Root436]|uniref:Gfo/Idh/MocA family protein n=1 Tax=Devosia sp. Root436 TaxID=1736537 RepID=UPI0006F5536E|nr:Gfo/Idh/MocA family oxidoreductase [Devosia sp. Root436]KQX42962.1 dehydrogenase [Devosia sp. Root436]
MKIALFGTSHWHAEMHLDAVRAAGATVVGVWDEDPAHAAGFADKHGLPFVVSITDGLALSPDLIVLMGHPSTLPGRARSLIETGIPLILEKPAASNTAAIAELTKLARERGTFVGVPLPNRFGPIFGAYSKLQETGRAGRLAHASFRLVNGPPERYRQDAVGWLLDPAIGGGGALRNLGIHGVDAVLSLAQGPVTLVSANIANRIHSEAVDDHALLVLSDAVGTLFTVEAGYTYASMAPGGEFEWRMVTANATLLDRGDSASCVTLDDARTQTLPPEPTATRYRLFMADTLQRLRDGRAPAITLDDYLAAMTLIDAAYAKARS